MRLKMRAGAFEGATQMTSGHEEEMQRLMYYAELRALYHHSVAWSGF